jgi:homoserine kinase
MHVAVEVLVPGSVANLGGGFDTLAVAVELYLRARIVDVRDDGGSRLTVVRSEPAVSGHNRVELGFETVARLTGRRAPSVFVEVESEIPMAAGLGSSAAAAVAGMRVFERVTSEVPESILLTAATAIEGHADNAAAALHGGLTSVVEQDDGTTAVLSWPWPDDLRLIVATPDTPLATAKARAALPDVVSRKDAVFNLQRVLSLVHALQSADYDRLRQAVQDRLHQPARAALVPQLGPALALSDPEVLGAFLSGAGPSVALLARREFARLERLLRSLYDEAGCAVVVRTLKVQPSSGMTLGAMTTAHGRTI